MDFFRKLCPLIHKTSTSENSNENNNSSIEHCPLEVDINSNVKSRCGDYGTNDDSNTHFNEKDFENILFTLENVAPIEMSLNSNSLEKADVTDDVVSIDAAILKDNSEMNIFKKIIDNETSHSQINIKTELIEIEVMINEVPKDAGIFNNITHATETNSLENIVNYTDPKQIEVTSEPGYIEVEILKDITLNNDIGSLKNVMDEETLQNLKEFEETLNNFDKAAYVTDDSGGEIINLDDFNDFFDDMDTNNEDCNTQSNFPERPFEYYSKITVDNNTVNEIKDLNKNVTHSARNIENIDVISIHSSTEDDRSQTDDKQDTLSIHFDHEETQNSDCDGYNSSDFEFISEAEAKMDGFIINFNLDNNQKHEHLSQASSELSTFSGLFQEENECQNIEMDASDPGEGPSGLNEPKSVFEDRSYRDNHAIPEGVDYLGLFQGIHNPMMPICQIYFMENKSVRASAMNIQYDGIGFDKQLALRRHQPDSSEEEFEDEAKECAKKILNMYPGENRKRRRRY